MADEESRKDKRERRRLMLTGLAVTTGMARLIWELMQEAFR